MRKEELWQLADALDHAGFGITLFHEYVDDHGIQRKLFLEYLHKSDFSKSIIDLSNALLPICYKIRSFKIGYRPYPYDIELIISSIPKKDKENTNAEEP